MNMIISTLLGLKRLLTLHLSFFSEAETSTFNGSRSGTVITVSKLFLNVSRGDNEADIRCKASHPAIQSGQNYPRLQDQAVLSVLCKCPLCNARVFLVENSF